MNQPSSDPIKLPRVALLLLYIVFSVSACADKSAIHENERVRYEALESELISAQDAEERQRRTELRVAQKLRQMDRERAAAAVARLQPPGQFEAGKHDASAASAESGSVGAAPTGPVVTQIVVGQSAKDNVRTWTRQYYPSPVDGSALCAVVSTPVTVTNGNIETLVSVIVSKDSVFLRTDATFDTNAVDIGYRIDAGIPIIFDHYLNELTAVVDDGYKRLLSQLETGDTLSVSFAYLPQLSSAETHIMEFPLASIEQPLSELAECDSQGARTLDADADTSAGS